ncbi:conserved hypothetical protein [Ricinus communis]|uniref:Uncharacterized protein n=1 Tax=Ricinus communis TaxID=3988 RepID=B9TFM1_RICCO|nr:conserved hypothetical protein [Ricinus communis]
MTEYPMLDDKLATLRNAIEGGVKADTMQAMKLMELVDAIGEQFKREVADAAAEPIIAGAVKTRIYPADFTDDLQWILGLMCFQCISYAQALRKGGRSIATKAEAEQAATLDYLLRHYLRDPENWRETASAELRAMMSDSATAKEGA